MRYICINRRRNQYPVRMMCRLLKVSRSGYYAWRVRPESPRAKTDRELTRVIRKLHAESRGVYGSPKMRDELKDVGTHIVEGQHSDSWIENAYRFDELWFSLSVSPIFINCSVLLVLKLKFCSVAALWKRDPDEIVTTLLIIVLPEFRP